MTGNFRTLKARIGAAFVLALVVAACGGSNEITPTLDDTKAVLKEATGLEWGHQEMFTWEGETIPDAYYLYANVESVYDEESPYGSASGELDQGFYVTLSITEAAKTATDEFDRQWLAQVKKDGGKVVDRDGVYFMESVENEFWPQMSVIYTCVADSVCVERRSSETNLLMKTDAAWKNLVDALYTLTHPEG